MARIEPLPQPLSFGKYELLERIAIGRMAEVFKARKSGVEGFEKILVVKRILPHLSHAQPFVNAFVEEAKLTVSLSHANIVQVLDLGQQDEAYFMAVELVPGYDLSTCALILQAIQKPLPVDIAVFAVSEVAKGLDYAHRRKDYNFESLNIVHRDLCPSNILISFEGEVKISDFGIARALEAAGTANDDLRRRYLYASPEQARGEHVTASSDIFTLGLVLYTLLTGHHPYHHDDPRAVVSLAQQAQIRPIQEILDLPRALVQIVNSTLAPSPEDRVDSAGTLYEELISYLFASGQKADNRSLSLFMQDLRIYEDQVFPYGNRPYTGPPQAWSAPAPQPAHAEEPEELDDAEFEELDLDDVADEDDMALPLQRFEDDEADHPPLSFAPQDSGAYAPMRAAQEPPAPQEPEAAPPEPAALPLDVAIAAHDLDAWLDALVEGLRRGEGVAVGLSGALGAAGGYLPDRLEERLAARGVAAHTLSFSPDHAAAPLALTARLLLRVAQMPDWALLPAPELPQRTPALDQQGVDALAAFGLDDAERTLGAHLLGLLPGLSVGAASRAAAAYPLTLRLLGLLAQERPAALILDGAHHLDPHSRALLAALSEGLDGLPVALLAAGGDLPLRALHLDGDDDAPDEEALIRGLDPAQVAALSALAVAEQPLHPSAIAQVTRVEPDDLHRALDALHQRRALRVTPDQRVALTSERLASILADELAIGALPDPAPIAARLERLAQRGALNLHAFAPLAGPLRVRLAAWQRHRDLAAQTALLHASRLDAAGWRDEAAEHLRDAYETLPRAEVGSPHLLGAFAAQRARLDLSRLRVEDARHALHAAILHADATHDTHALLDARLLAGRLALADDDPWAAFAAFQEARRAAARNHLPILLTRARLAMARWHLEYGSVREADQEARAAHNLIDRHDLRPRYPRLAARALTLSAEAAALRGQQHLAAHLAEQLDALAALQPDAATLLHAGYLRAVLLAHAFDPVQAADEAETLAATAADFGHEDLQARLLRLAAQAALNANDLPRALRLAQDLLHLAEHHQHAALRRAAHDLSALGAVLTSTGDRVLDALQGLQQALSRAVERKASRDQLDAHLALYRALNHLGSGADAEHHREEALRFCEQVGATTTSVHLDAL